MKGVVHLQGPKKKTCYDDLFVEPLPAMSRPTFQDEIQAAVGEDQLGGEAPERKMLVIVSVGHFQRLQGPVKVSTEREDKKPL